MQTFLRPYSATLNCRKHQCQICSNIFLCAYKILSVPVQISIIIATANRMVLAPYGYFQKNGTAVLGYYTHDFSIAIFYIFLTN